MSSWGMLAVSKSIQTPEQAVQFLKLILLGGLSTNPMNASLGFVSVGEVATPPEAREARGAGGGSTVRARDITGGPGGASAGARRRRPGVASVVESGRPCPVRPALFRACSVRGGSRGVPARWVE